LNAPVGRRAPNLEVLYFEGCPNHEALASRLPELLDHAGLEAELTLQPIESEEEAQRARFLGSPTVRVDGRDIEPDAAERTDFGLKCRLYRTPEGVAGLPSEQLIVDAVANSADP